MERYCVQFEAGRAGEAASLLSWLLRQETEVSYAAAPQTMGGGEVLTAVVVGGAALRGLVLVAREWIRAHRTRISVRLEGKGSFEVEGTADVDELVALLRESASPNAVGPESPAKESVDV